MKELSFPENITLEKELLPGLLKKDTKKLIGLALPGTAAGITVWLCCERYPLAQFIALASTMLYLCLCYAVIVRIDGSMSIYSYLSLLNRFHREQQRFRYKQPKEVLYHAKTTGSQASDGAGIY